MRQDLDPVGRSLRRDAGRLEVGVCDSYQLAGAQCTDPYRSTKLVCDGSSIGYDETGLPVWIQWASRGQKTAPGIDGDDSVGCDSRRQVWSLGCTPDYDQVCISLWRYASGHAGGKYSIYPHALADSAQA